ncbi:uncharacterized protein METZ01_LOCUS125461, partial [marine metagenome]
IMRVSADSGADATDIVGQTITGKTSGATTVVLNATVFFQGSTSISELEIDAKITRGTFQTGEVITSASNSQDVEMKFTVVSFVASADITVSGGLYSITDSIWIDSDIGNGQAEAEVSEITSGGISEVIIDDRGSGYRVGDELVFTSAAIDTDVETARAFISVIDGSILLEDTGDGDKFLILETDTNVSLINFTFILEGTDSEGTDEGDKVLINATNGSEKDAGYYFITEQTALKADIYGSDFDRIVVDEGAADTEGEISRIFITDPGGGYRSLPSVSVTSSTGTNEKLLALSEDIGQVLLAKIVDGGFNYTDAPEGKFNVNFVLKDISGTFTPTNPFTTAGHVGEVVSFDSTNNRLEGLIENRERIELEAVSNAFQENFELERAEDIGDDTKGQFLKVNNAYVDQGAGILLEDGSGGRLISDALETYVNQINIERLNNAVVLDHRVEMEQQASDASLEDMFGFNVVQAREQGFPDQFYHPSNVDLFRGYNIKLDGVNTPGSMLLNRTDGGSTDAGDEILLDGTDGAGTDAGDKVLNSLFTSEGDDLLYEPEVYYKLFSIKRDKLQLDGGVLQRFTAGGWITDDGTNDPKRIIDPIFQGTRVSDESDGILLEDALSDADSGVNTKEFLVMEFNQKVAPGLGYAEYIEVDAGTINHDNTPAQRIKGQNDEALILENSFDLPTIGDSTYIVIDNHFLDGEVLDVRLLLEDGGYIIDEEFGSNVMQESGLNFGDFPTVTGDIIVTEGEVLTLGYMQLDGTDSSYSNAGSYIISESDPDFLNDIITDGSGATGTVVSSDVARLTFNVDVESEREGFYRNTDHHISDGVIRLQDSFFYQDFSYEIKIGQSVNLYLTELKKAVHPAGFAAFGRVTLATSVAAAIQIPAGGDVVDYTGDELFTPALASFFDEIFQIEIGRRLGVAKLFESELFDFILLEEAYLIRQEDDEGYVLIDQSPFIFALEDDLGNLILDGTDGSSTDAGFYINADIDNAADFILGEETLTDENIITEDKVGNQRIATERSAGPPDADKDVELTQKVVLTVSIPQPTFYTFAGSRSGLPLFAEVQAIRNGMECEDATTTTLPTIIRDVILSDGLVLESGDIGEAGEVMEWETATDADFGSGLTFDDLQWISNEDFILEQSATFNDVIQLEYATDPQVDVNTPNRMLLDRTDGVGSNANSRLLGEDDQNSFGDDLVLDGTDGSSTDAGTKFVTEDILNGEVNVDEIIRPSLLSVEGLGILDNFDQNHFMLEGSQVAGDIIQEVGHEIFVLDGTDGSSTDAGDRIFNEDGGHLVQEIGLVEKYGDRMSLESSTSPQNSGNLTLEVQHIEVEDGTSSGTIPEINFRETNFVHFTRPAVIKNMASGRIALQDDRQPINVILNGTDGGGTDAGDSLVLNQTSGAGKDAEDNVQYQDLLHTILEQHHPGFVIIEDDGTDGNGLNAGAYIDFEIGTKPPFDYTLEGAADATTYDSTQTTYDNTQQTYDTTA